MATTDPLQKKSNVSFVKPLKDIGAFVKQAGTSIGSSNWINPVSKGLDVVSGLAASNNTSIDPTALSIRNGITDAVSNLGGPVGKAVGTALKIVDTIGDLTGMHLDNIDTGAAKKAGASGAAALNNAMTALPGVGTLSSFFAGQTMKKEKLTDEGESVMEGYSGSQSDMNTSDKLANKRTLFGLRKMNRFIENTNRQTRLINDIAATNALAKKSDYGTDIAQQNLNRYAGTNYQMFAVGKRGMKIMSRTELQRILATRKLQNGGVIGTDVNLIPDGSLHARLNHLQDLNPDLEDTTRKGIPVLDANGEQVAEIEVGEITFTKSLTDKIEELMKDGSEEAMIEAGRLLSVELIENTQDNAGLLEREDNNGK